MSEQLRGIIIRALSGFYDVDTGNKVVRCRARGKMRKTGVSPMVGDQVLLQFDGNSGYILELQERKNYFMRPSVANVDKLVMMGCAVNPVTDPFLIDRVSAIAVAKSVDVYLILTKCDLDPADNLFSIYSQAGIQVVRSSAKTGEGIEQIRRMLSGSVVVFTGNSGVGKSSMLNALFPEANIATGEVSQKLGRGRHTTRHVELFKLPDGTQIMDTPGFSSFDITRMELGNAEDLAWTFPEFRPYLGLCQFNNCQHVSEQGCAVIDALKNGKIEISRHDSYVRIYKALKECNAWEQKKS